MRQNIFILFCSCVICFLLIIFSCKKEYSKEGGDLTATAKGLLLDSAGNCNNVVISGNYNANTVFNDSNYIIVTANITSPGNYTIFSDTVNGFYFKASGIVNSNGLQTFKLKAFGKPLLPLNENFTIYFDESICSFSFPVSDMAIYTFAGTGGSCTNAVVNGTYSSGILLNAPDTVNIQLNVIKPGTYKIETPVINGISFSANGNFATAGSYIVTLAGTGTPVNAGVFIIPVSAAGIECSFPVTVTDDAAITNTVMYWQFSAGGILYSGSLDSAVRGSYVNTNYPLNNIFQLQCYGRDKDSVTSFINFQLNISRVNNSLSTGSYSPAIAGSKDFIGHAEHTDYSGNLSATNSQPSFTINVTGYDTVSRLVQGNFSGPVINQYGVVDTMKNGLFSTYFKKQ